MLLSANLSQFRIGAYVNRNSHSFAIVKIFVLANTLLFESAISGGDVVLPRIVRYWDGDDFEIHVITSSFGRKTWELQDVEATFHELKDSFWEKYDGLALAWLTYLTRTFKANRLLKNLLEKESEPCLIYTSSDLFPDVIPAFLNRRRFCHIKWMARIYHVNKSPLVRKGNPLFNLFSFVAQRIGFFYIKTTADLISPLVGAYKELQQLGFPQDRMKISNAGVATELIKQTVPLNKTYDAVHVGALTYTKGVYDLLDVWKMIVAENPKAKLAIVGGGSKSMMDRYRRKIRQMSLSQHIDYYGFLPSNQDVYSIVKSSRIYICPGHENGWSLPVTEAMSAGIPIVAYQLAMFGTAFKKGFVTVPIHDKIALKHEIQHLLIDETKRRLLGAAALEESQNFDWKTVSDRLREYIMALQAH